ncbi:sugar phosphate nucleotidyltransferase, partial [Sulfurivirga sp.]|uniref:sugar phosphate nucleotidyltransferase n=1 Tax=Sulfurivirga sp. TaxID=2614236 RepID=UPI0025CF9EAA
RLKSIEEKPVVQQFVSAGIYVLNPEVIRGIDRVPVDVPDVLERLQGQAQPVGVFPLHEYWLDIGRMDDFHRAQEEYASLFD